LHGVGNSTSAITIVNALFTGIGSAIGIDLKVRAEVDLSPVAPSAATSVQIDPAQDSPLTRESVRTALHCFAPRKSFHGFLRVDSEIPPARGLKSSSAVSTAIFRAVASAMGVHPAPIEVARHSADLTQRIGLSATGAFDDALAALVPGFVVTDNRERKSIRFDAVAANWTPIVWVPFKEHPPSTQLLSEFREHAEAAREAGVAATKGRYPRAMTLNTELVERVMGYDYRRLRETLSEAGAIASGVSGMGPSLAVLALREAAEKIAGLLPSDRGETRILSFSENPSPVEGSA
jgi:shikimate kinase